jgi:hypothetical protein
MKKYVFFTQLLFVVNALAQNTSSEDEFRCMRKLNAHMNPKHYYEPANLPWILPTTEMRDFACATEPGPSKWLIIQTNRRTFAI